MTTVTQREHMRRQLAAAQHRAERATEHGDHAGHLIAASDARRILARMTAASEADYAERAR